MSDDSADEGQNEAQGETQSSSGQIPLLPLRDIVVFPHMVVPLFVGRPKSIQALEDAMAGDRQLVVAAQRVAGEEDPTPEDIYSIGTLGTIIQLLRLPDGTVKVLVEGKTRAEIREFSSLDPYFAVQVNELPDEGADTPEAEALVRSIHSTFDSYSKLNKKIAPETVNSVSAIFDPGKLSDTIVAHLNLKLPDRQKLLEVISASERLEEVFSRMQAEIEVLEVERKIRGRVKKQMERSQKEYYLNEQMRAIQKELGDRDQEKDETTELEEQLAAKEMPEDAREKVEKEMKKLKQMSPMAAEATVVRNYIDWMLSLPWDSEKEEESDLNVSQNILDADHYGLEKPKDRILEYLAIQTLVEKSKGPILCLVGPPGVGKTSLGKSIARSTGRDFVRISLGGVRDEAEIRGHRRTYIGAMPGKIIQGLKKAGSSNPVFLLDEIDKMSTDFRGDPSSAMLEVLDPEQNNTFEDHYLDVEYDLSGVMFICTANVLSEIPRPLMDRMEIIQIPGYIESEKLEIAKAHLVDKVRTDTGLSEDDVQMTEGALLEIIRHYTRESGVRGLEREIAAVIRKVAREKVSKGDDFKAIKVSPKLVRKFLGVQKYRFGQTEEEDRIGVTTGLAYTEVGGELLQTEVAVTPGKGKLQVTGRLGEVMTESANAALSYIRSRAKQLGLTSDFHTKVDIHIHVPEGGTPKDGPSAGITLATTLASALTRIPVRSNVAMTGEITLRGRVLPIGGLKEKLIAAHRGGIDTVIVPKENEKDLKDLPVVIKKNLKIIIAEHMDEVLRNALAVANPDHFLEDADGIHEIEDIYIAPGGLRATAEVPHPAGVN
ncbi:MAG: endopeptidase La [Myxococcota bacterium]